MSITAEQIDTLAELLPCPFCGAKADMLLRAFVRATDDFAYWSVECRGCGVEVADSESQGAADIHWNTRDNLRDNLPAIREQSDELERFKDRAVNLDIGMTEIRDSVWDGDDAIERIRRCADFWLQGSSEKLDAMMREDMRAALNPQEPKP